MTQLLKHAVLRHLCLLIMSVCLNGSALAITIGDYQVISANSLSIPVSQLDKANYLDVTVDVSGQPINYILEQVDADLVLIKVSDELLASKDALITVKVDSPNGSASRLFSYSSTTANYQISDTQQAREALKEKQNPELTGKVLIPAMVTDELEEEQEVKFEDGKLLIDINRSAINVGIAVYELARASNYNVLVLPGDENVFNSPLLHSVSRWEDLYLASDKVVRQVFFDESRRLVRVVGEDFLLGVSEMGLAELDQDDTQSVDANGDQIITVRELLAGYAQNNNLELLEMPGDNYILDQKVTGQNVTDIKTLAMLANSVQAKIDIDENLGLIRVRN